VREAPAPLEHGFTLLEHEAVILDDGDEDVSGSDPQLAADLGRDHEAAWGPTETLVEAGGSFIAPYDAAEYSVVPLPLRVARATGSSRRMETMIA